MSNTEEYIKLLHKEMQQFIDEGYEKLDQQEYEMKEIGLIMHGQSDYYYQNPDEYEKDKKICELENEVERLERRLSNCLEPKFKQGDYLYSVEKSGSQIFLAEGYVTTITQLDDGSIWYHLSLKPHEFGVRENTCYKTMDEVHEVSQKLLKEIDDEQNNRKS